MENKYYIYVHINPLKNEIFYIGKGCGNRYKSKWKRSDYWKNIVTKYGYIYNILESDLTEEEAFEREKWYINKIGRKDLGKGSLINMTDGGDGCKKPSEITKIKISNSLKGNIPHNKGKTNINWLLIEKMIIEGYSQYYIAKKLNCDQGNISRFLKNKNK